jgi:hypothetical protein
MLDPVSEIKSVHISKTTEEHPYYHHITAYELKQLFEQRGWEWDSYYKFCVVRNPFDRLVSLYNFHLREGNIKPQDLNSNKGFISNRLSKNRGDPDFTRFVSRIKPAHRLPIGLKAFTHDLNGRCLVDHVFEFEKLNEQIPTLIEKFGQLSVDTEIPHLNATNRLKRTTSYFNDIAVSRVNTLYKYEIERFNYSLPGY